MRFTLTTASIALIAVTLLFYTGFGVTRLLSFRRIHGDELLIAPFVGFSLMITVGYWCGWMGWSTGVILAVVLVISTLFNLLALLRRRGVPFHIRAHLPILALASMTFAVAVYPMWQGRTLGPIGINGDQVWYTNVTASLEENSYPPPASSSRPALVQLVWSYDLAFPLGFSYLHAFIDKLTWRKAHDTFSLVTAVWLALNVLVYPFLATCVLGVSPGGRWLIALLTAASPALMWVHYNNYAVHLMGLGLVPLAFGAIIVTVEEGRRYMVLPALLLSAALATYPAVTTALALCPALLYVAHGCVRQRIGVSTSLQTLVALAALAAILNLRGALDAVESLYDMLDFGWLEFGDVQRYAPWAEVYGLSHHRPLAEMDPLAPVPALSLMLTFCALLLTGYGVWRMKEPGRTAFVSLGLIYVPLLFWLRYGLDYPYGFFKTLTFATFPALTGLALGLDGLRQGRKKRFGWFRFGIALALVSLIAAVNVVNLSALSRWVVTIAPDFPSLLGLQQVKRLIRDTDRIHIRDASDTPLLWMTYFLKDYELSLAHYTPYFLRRDWPFYQEAISAELVLVNKDSPVDTPWAVETVYENSRYRFLRKDPRILSYVDAQGGGVPLERGDTVKVEVFTDHLTLNGRNITLGRSMHGGEVLRIGALAVAGSAVSLSTADKTEKLLLSQNVYAFDCPISRVPAEVRLTNAGERALLVLGWLEVIDTMGKPDCGPVKGDIFGRFREEVIPNASVFVVSGWHALEEGRRRWTDRVTFAVFRNPFKPIILILEGFLPSRPVGTSPGKAHILLNGQVLGELNRPGVFRQTYLISEQILGSSESGILETYVESTFNPKTSGVSQDPRDLGIALTRLEILDLELPADGFIDIGARQARRYLGDGWSEDEQSEGGTFVWADARESLLRVSLSHLSDVQVDLRVMPLRYPSSPLQGLSVYVNERYLQDIILRSDDWQVHTVHVPQAFLALGLNTFRFVYRYTASPAQVLPGSRDPRTLAVAWDFLAFRRQ